MSCDFGDVFATDFGAGCAVGEGADGALWLGEVCCVGEAWDELAEFLVEL